MDVSGDATKSNYNYLGIVAGLSEQITQRHESVKHLSDHMRQ